MSEPLLPYAGTSGHSGSDTSEQRARTEDSNGTTAARQQATLTLAHDYRTAGITVKDLTRVEGWHHGQASSVLSVLHKEGRLARLTESRNRCKVYVLPEYVHGRDTEKHGRTKPSPLDNAHLYTLAQIKDGTGFEPGARFVQIDLEGNPL